MQNRPVSMNALILTLVVLFMCPTVFGQVPSAVAAAGDLRALQPLGDLDNDGFSELAGIRLTADKRSELVSLEVGESGAMSTSWRFGLPENIVGRWADLTITDLNLNGRPEIVAVVRMITTGASQNAPWLYAFEWSGTGFPYVPTFQWGLKNAQGLYPRPGQIETGDLDRDGLGEVVIALSTPQPQLLILEFSGDLNAPVVSTEYNDLPEPLSKTPDPFTFGIHDVDDDGALDVVLFQKRGATIFGAQLSASGEDTYTTVHQVRLPVSSDGPELIRPAAIAFADLEQKGRTSTFIGTTSGRVYRYDFSSRESLVSQAQPLAARVWQTFPGPVQALSFSDEDGDGLAEVFLRTGENTFYLEQERAGSSNFANFNSLLEEEVFHTDLSIPLKGELLVGRGGKTRLQTTSLTTPEPVEVEEEATEAEALPEEEVAETEAVEEEVDEPTAAERLQALSEEAQELEQPKPIRRKPRPATVVLHVGEVFSHTVPRLDEMDPGMASVNFRTYPEGMRLGRDFVLRWTPEAYQLGYHSISYTFGNLVDTTFTIYVNDKPIIYSTPPLLAITGDQYLYQVQLEDLNAEGYFDFTLDTAPSGMQVDEEGLVRWLPSDTQLDSQYVTLSVSDGFETVSQKFTLYVNIKPVILEKPAPVAFVTEEYVGFVKFQDKNTNNNARLIPIRLPGGLVLESSGRVSWTPETNQTGFHDILFEMTDDMSTHLDSFTLFANTPPRIISQYDEHVPVGKPWHYNVEVADPNNNQDISFLLSESTIPNLTISRRGRIAWTPTEADLGPQSFIVSVSDGLRDDLQRVTLYVNATPQIGTTSDTLATLAKTYTTYIPVTDLNKGQPLLYSFLDAPKGMTINNTGQISWRPTKAQKGWNEVFVKVADAYSSDTYKFKVYANAPPLIVSQPDTMAIATEEYVYELSALDLNSEQQLTFRVFDAPPGVELTEGSIIRWTPTIDQINKRQFKVSVTDGYLSHVQVVDLFVNARPEVTSEPKGVLLTDQEFHYELNYRDLNEDAVSYHQVMLPAGAEMDEAEGIIEWTPDAANEGENQFIIEVKDARGSTNLHEFTVHVFADPKTPLRQMGAFLITLAGIGAMFIIKFLY